MNIDFSSAINKKMNRDRIEFQNQIIGANIWQTCLNCKHFQNDVCLLCNQTPPTRILILGCESYSSNIPF